MTYNNVDTLVKEVRRVSDFVVCHIGQPTCCPDEDVVQVLLAEYERIVVRSLITSFGLDFIANTVSGQVGNPGIAMDRHGGDVDTILNVRQIGIDSRMAYKSQDNADAYETRGAYDSHDYHNQPNYRAIKHDTRAAARDSGTGVIEDDYTGGRIAFTTSKGNPGHTAELDHVISAKWIHDDRGRVLARQSGQELSDSPENYKFTNKSLNASMGAQDIMDYIDTHRDELAPEQIERMTKAYEEARESYEEKLESAYYSSPKFAADLAKAAGKQSLKMAARQVCGLVFAEIWFAVKEELAKVESGFDPAELAKAIGNGVKRGFGSAKSKYKELLTAAENGALSGALASVTTTLCNIFFTTSKNMGKIIRESYASLVDAGRVLLFNPDGYLMGEQLRAAAKILATGASVVLGSVVMELIAQTPIAAVPIVGVVVQTFCGALVSGVLSCTLLLFLDRSEWVNKLVDACDKAPTIDKAVDDLRQQAEYFAKYAAMLENIDYDRLEEEIAIYRKAADSLAAADSQEELNATLKAAASSLGISIPWEGSFDSFMAAAHSKLVFT